MGTPKGQTKKLIVEQKGNLYFIRYEGGGELPKDLEGMFTSPDIANQFIRTYESKKA